MRISDWSSDVCASDLRQYRPAQTAPQSGPPWRGSQRKWPGRSSQSMKWIGWQSTVSCRLRILLKRGKARRLLPDEVEGLAVRVRQFEPVHACCSPVE